MGMKPMTALLYIEWGLMNNPDRLLQSDWKITWKRDSGYCQNTRINGERDFVQEEMLIYL